jgi:hypothetical protein
MTGEDRQAELNYIYETARLNGHAREPIEKLGIKNRNRQRIRQVTTLTPLEKETQKYATTLCFPRITIKLVNIFAKQRVGLVFTNEN